MEFDGNEYHPELHPDPKTKTHRDKKYLLWIRTQPCASCGQLPIEGTYQVVPAHSGGGMALKGPDRDAIPLCVACHGIDHTVGPFQEVKGVNRMDVARAHWKRYQESLTR